MKNNNLKRFLLTGIVIIFLGLLQSCEMKDGDDFYPMRFNLLENSNHDNILIGCSVLCSKINSHY